MPRYLPAAVALLRSTTRVSELQALGLLDVLHRRIRSLSWAPHVASITVFVGWMILFGKGTDALEGTRYDLLAYLHRHGGLGIAVGFMLGIGAASALAATAYYALRRHLVMKQLRLHLATPACFHCGYALSGLSAPNALIACPECGNHSPTVRPL